MREIGKEPPPPELRRARERFQDWLLRRQPGQRIPTELWDLAARLAQTHGLSRAATALGLDYYSLKRRVQPTAEPTRPAPRPPTFVELTPASLTPIRHCRLQWEPGDGSSLRLELTGFEAADLEALARGIGAAR